MTPQPQHQTPAELVEWIETTSRTLEAAARRIRRNSKPGVDQPVGDWLTPLLSDFAAVEDLSRRCEHVLSAYALRSGVMGAAHVAKLTGVTVTAATNRAASRVTRETWPTVFGHKA